MTDRTAAPETPPKRRWRKVLLISGGSLAGLFLLAFLLGPLIIGSVAASEISSILAEGGRAETAVEDVSFSWSGRVVMTGFRLTPAGFSDPMVEIPEARVDLSLWSALGGEYVADVEIMNPRFVVEKNADGRFNYDLPPPPEEEKGSSSSDSESGDQAHPFVDATLRVRGGEIVVRADGAETIYRNLNADVRVDTLDKPVAYGVTLEDPGGGTLALKGEYGIEQQGGPLSLTLKDLSLENLNGAIRAYSPIRALEGRLNGTFGYSMRLPAAFSGSGRLALEGRATISEGNTLRLDDIRLGHTGDLDENGSGVHHVTLSWAKAASFDLKIGVRDAFETPKLKVELGGKGDLAEVVRALEDGIGLKPGFKLAGGVTIEGTGDMEGSENISFDLKGGAMDLRAEDGEGKRFGIDPAVEFKAAGSWDGTMRFLEVESLTLVSSVGSVAAEGGVVLAEPFALKESSLTADLDLKALGNRLDAFLSDAPGLDGSATLKASFTGDRYALEGTAKDLRLTTTEKGKPSSFGPITARIVQRGTLKDGTLKIEQGSVVSGAIDAELSGEINAVFDEARKGRLALGATVRPVVLSRWLDSLKLGGPEFKVDSTLNLEAGILSLAGEAELEGLIVGEGKEAQTLRAKPLAFSVERKEAATTAGIRSAALEWSRGGYVVKASVDARLDQDGTSSRGSTTFKTLEVIDPEKRSAREQDVTLVHEVGFAGETTEIRKAEISSGFLRGGLTGTVANLESEPVLDAVRGTFRYVPARLGAVLAPWLPGTLEGKEERTLEFALDGKAKEADLLSVLRGSEGSLHLDLARFTTQGLSLSGRTEMDLKGAKATLKTPLDVNGGTAEMDLALDLRPPVEKPKSALTFKAKNVQANGNMGPLLSKISPLFHVTGVDAALGGRVDSEFNLAWDGPPEFDSGKIETATRDRLSGTGTLGMKNLSIQGSPVAGLLLDVIVGTGNHAQGELLPTPIVVGGGRCSYRNMTLRLKRYELRFSGWVAFDGRMELMVEMPITERLGRRYPGLGKYLGTTMFVPLRGTVDRPRLDFQAAVSEVLKRTLQNKGIEGVLKGIEDLLKRRKKE